MLTCGHEEKNWYSICSAHHGSYQNILCGLCKVGRCIKCYPEAAAVGGRLKFYNKDTGAPENPFPNLGVRKA